MSCCDDRRDLDFDREQGGSSSNASLNQLRAKQKQIGLVSFWAIQRDQVCPSGTTALDRCSRVNTSKFQFSTIFASVNAN